MGSGMITCMSRGPFHPGRPTPGRPTDRSPQGVEELRARSVKPRRGKSLFRVALAYTCGLQKDERRTPSARNKNFQTHPVLEVCTILYRTKKQS